MPNSTSVNFGYQKWSLWVMLFLKEE